MLTVILRLQVQKQKADESDRAWSRSWRKGYSLVMRKLIANSDLKF